MYKDTFYQVAGRGIEQEKGASDGTYEGVTPPPETKGVCVSQ